MFFARERGSMVFPVGGLATPGLGSYGPPPEEVLRILPALKACVVAVALMVIGEFVATYYQEAISELLNTLVWTYCLARSNADGPVYPMLGSGVRLQLHLGYCLDSSDSVRGTLHFRCQGLLLNRM